MDKEHLFISNIHSTHQDRISVTYIYDSLSKEAHQGCGLYDEIYESWFISLLRHHLSQLNEQEQASSGDMPKVRARRSMIKHTVRH